MVNPEKGTSITHRGANELKRNRPAIPLGVNTSYTLETHNSCRFKHLQIKLWNMIEYDVQIKFQKYMNLIVLKKQNFL